jgi:hypothetical protein
MDSSSQALHKKGLHNSYFSPYFSQDELDGACGTYQGRREIQGFVGERKHLEDLSIQGGGIHLFDKNSTRHVKNLYIQLFIQIIILVTTMFYTTLQHATSSIDLRSSASLTLCSWATTKVVFSVTRFDPRLRLSSFSHAPFCECVCRQV